MKFWSEVPSARARELVADVATWSWVSLWAVVAFRLYSTLAGYAEVGRAIGRGGANIQSAGDQVGDSLGGLPLVGEQVRGLTRSAFGAAGEPFVFVGDQLEQLLLMIAALLGVLVLGVTLIPWLSRYVPWRARRLFELRTAHRAIRLAPRDVPEAAVEHLLASRALHRLTYGELLEHTPDPIGDFATGRYDRLARAELESVGLRG
ncbi:MAG: hypothetical protein Q7S35_11550 [Candidatus Limnocylindrales bacterium]|nr:hypothetical protein [Candidatus Limnocylindrales bacterium]